MSSIYILSFNQIELEDVEAFLNEESAKERLLRIYMNVGKEAFHRENYTIQILQASENDGFRMTYRGFKIDDHGDIVSVDSH
jgi:hypothetical protein